MKTIKNVAIYCRVSTSDQITDRQEIELKAFADRAGYTVVDTFIETASGSKNDRQVRAAVMKLAKGRHIDAVLVTELSRWGRSTTDLLTTIQEMAGWDVALISLNNKDLDYSSPTGALMLTVLAAISQFEKALLIERTNSGLAAARARGAKFGRPKLKEKDKAVSKHRKAVTAYLKADKSYRWIADELHISKDTVMAISKELQVTA